MTCGQTTLYESVVSTVMYYIYIVIVNDYRFRDGDRYICSGWSYHYHTSRGDCCRHC